jgi:hypothetical protein
MGTFASASRTTGANAARDAALNAITATVNNGSLRIYSGTAPANADGALSGNTLLAQLTLGATAFGAAASGVATANAITDDTSADATGTPTKGCVPDGVCVLTADSNQSIANATWVPVDWNVETIDSQGMHSTSSNTELIVPNGAGWYLVTATIAFSANATGIRAIRILVSGNTAQGGHAQVAASNNADALNSVSVSCVVYMSATDNVKVEAYQNSSGALNVLRINSQFSARRIEQMGAT